MELARFDYRAVEALLGKAKALCDAGGDWERKNKFKARLGGRVGDEQGTADLSAVCESPSLDHPPQSHLPLLSLVPRRRSTTPSS